MPPELHSPGAVPSGAVLSKAGWIPRTLDAADGHARGIIVHPGGRQIRMPGGCTA